MPATLTAFVLAAAIGQDPKPPVAKPEPSPHLQRFVDFSAALADPGTNVHIGRLGKPKEGKRERLPGGKLGGAGSSVSISGTQFYKVEASVPMKVKEVLRGIKPGTVTLLIDLQLARLPDGNERRQVLSGNGAEINEGTLGLFVFEPSDSKGQRLLHAIPLDPRLDDGVDAERDFTERMRDFYTVNTHIAALRGATAAVDAAKDAETRGKALAELRQRVDERPTLLRKEDEPLLATHVAPLEREAAQRLEGSGGEGK
jgi:hypothetical protein